jgi:hypothetical protein
MCFLVLGFILKTLVLWSSVCAYRLSYTTHVTIYWMMFF